MKRPNGLSLPLVAPVLSLLLATTPLQAEPPAEPILRIEAGMHTASISKIAMDAENRYLVTASRDKTARVWELATGKLIRTLRPPIGGGNQGNLHAIAISPDGTTIACGGFTGYEWERSYVIYLFDFQSGRLKSRITGLPGTIFYLIYSKDGKYLAATLGDRSGIRLFRTSDYSLVAEDTDYGDSGSGADFDAGGRLVTASFDGYTRLYEIRMESPAPLKILAKRKLHRTHQPHHVAFSSDGSKIAVGFINSTEVNVLSGTDLSYLFSPNTSGVKAGSFKCVTWSLDGRFLYAGKDHARPLIIRKWSDAGKGGYKDLSATNSGINHILPLKDGGIVFASNAPDFGVFGSDDKRRIHQSSPNADFRYNFGGFLISKDGTTLRFSYEISGKSPAQFSIANRLLQPKTLQDPTVGLQKPIMFDISLKIADMDFKPNPKIDGRELNLNKGDISRYFAISPDSKAILVGGNGHLYLFDWKSDKKWNVPIPGMTWAVNISGDKRVAVAALADGTIRWYRMSDGKELLAFFPHKDKTRWALWTPSGYYDCSEGADELIGWHVNQGKDKEAAFYPVARFFEQFYRPELITEVARTLDADKTVLARLGEKERVNMETAIQLPPRLSFISPKSGEVLDREGVTIKVMAEDMGGGVDEIRLFHNGKATSGETRDLKLIPAGNFIEKAFSVQMVEGLNRFTALAFSKERIESDLAEMTLTFKGVSKESDLHLILIGINRYKNPALNLNYAEPDALSIRDFFVSAPVKRLFGRVYPYSLINEKATKDNVKKLFEEVKEKARLQDTVLFYMGGHGDIVGSEWFFIPHDVVTPEVEESVKKGGISMKEITETVKGFRAQKVFIVIDSCKSGRIVTAMTGFRGFEDRKVLIQLARSTGTYILSASTDQQFASEVKELGHGVLTYAMLEGLGGKAGERKVTVEGLIHYIKNRLPELTEKYRGAPQWPVSWGTGMDFPLVLY